MWSLAERWCDFSPRIRLGVGVLMLGLLMAIGAYCRREPMVDAAPVALNAQWRKIMPLRGDIAVAEIPPVKSFSVLDFDTPDSHLVSWQPVGAGGELTLEANWQSIPPLFIQLAERGRAVRGFSIVPEQQRLKMTLQLEALPDD
jgi:pilus assembly protein HofO